MSDDFLDGIRELLENGEEPPQRVTNKMLFVAIQENYRILQETRGQLKEHNKRIDDLESFKGKLQAWGAAFLALWGILITILNIFVF